MHIVLCWYLSYVDLTKQLDDQVVEKHSQDGKPSFTLYALSYSNFDLIKVLITTVNDSEQEIHLNTAKPQTDINYLCMVDTHISRCDYNYISITKVMT